MAKPGWEGGCLATPVARTDTDTTYDRREVIQVARPEGQPVPPPGGVCTADELLALIQGMKYKRCVPAGRARKELYQMLMNGDP